MSVICCCFIDAFSLIKISSIVEYFCPHQIESLLAEGLELTHFALELQCHRLKIDVQCN